MANEPKKTEIRSPKIMRTPFPDKDIRSSQTHETPISVKMKPWPTASDWRKGKS